ncbi:MAG: hypothetical protein NQU46_07900 [Methanolinea sp.]|nr:hypothetical protein [Methanolinea sp.]
MSDRFYPFSFPAFFLTGDIFVINGVLIAHLVIAYLTSFALFSLLKREYDIPLPVLALFSLVYACSGAMLARIMVGHIFIVYALAWIPLLYYAYFRIVRYYEHTMSNILIFLISSLFILFSASVYYLFFAYLFIALLLGFEYLQFRDWKIVLPLVMGITLFFLVGAIKIVPGLFIEDWIVRVDPIDPLSNGGSLESNLASFIFGTSITKGFQIAGFQFGDFESMVLIGLIPVFFLILGFIFGQKKWIIPVFLSLVAALIWADGGKTLLSFVHLFPVVQSFRCPGRIFAPLVPLLLLVSIQGFAISLEKFRTQGKFSLTAEQKRFILYGAGVLIALKLTEIPFQETVTPESWVSIIFIAAVIILLYFDRMSTNVLLVSMIVGLGLNAIGIALNHPISTVGAMGTAAGIGVILAITMWLSCRELRAFGKPALILSLILLLGIIIPITGSISHLSPVDPRLDESPAREIAETLHTRMSGTAQSWVLTTGQSYYYIDYTYWLIRQGLHPVRAYYAYYLENSVDTAYKIENTTYYSADFIVDIQSLKNGETILPGVSFTSAGIPVFQPQNVLPNVFILRHGTVLPVSIITFEPDRVIARDSFSPGDIVILKYSYFEGWTVNGEKAVPAGNMIGYRVTAPVDEVIFKFDFMPYKAGLVLSLGGVVLVGILFMMRKRIERMMQPAATRHITPSRRGMK